MFDAVTANVGPGGIEITGESDEDMLSRRIADHVDKLSEVAHTAIKYQKRINRDAYKHAAVSKAKK